MIHTGKASHIIEESASRILDTQPDAIVRVCLLRDVLGLSAQDEALLSVGTLFVPQTRSKPN